MFERRNEPLQRESFQIFIPLKISKVYQKTELSSGFRIDNTLKPLAMLRKDERIGATRQQRNILTPYTKKEILFHFRSLSILPGKSNIYVLFCLFSSTCVLQSVCVHTMDFVSAHKQIN